VERAKAIVESADLVVSFSGAGLSQESGIPTFRDADGIWTTVDPLKMASVDGFLADPEGVIAWYDERRVFIAGKDPNPAHRALAAANGMVHVTQNIDPLLERAGVADPIHLHGVIDRDHCQDRCGHTELVDPAHPPGLRACPACGSLMRPSIVWFGEMLPQREWFRAQAALSAADAVIVVGTSGEVYPAAGLIDLARDHGAKVIVVNPEETPAGAVADVDLRGLAGEILPELLAPRR
jgi:NAD-dependent deacetylase